MTRVLTTDNTDKTDNTPDIHKIRVIRGQNDFMKRLTAHA